MTESGWILNASPLILFARADLLELLSSATPSIRVPSAVIEEVRAGQHKDRTAGTAVRWAEQRTIPDVQIPGSILCWDIGPGESQVLAHCLGTNRWAVLDDRMAHRCAKAHHIPTIGSLGIVLRAKRLGHIPKAEPVIDELRRAGMYINDALVNQCLVTIGEDD